MLHTGILDVKQSESGATLQWRMLQERLSQKKTHSHTGHANKVDSENSPTSECTTPQPPGPLARL